LSITDGEWTYNQSATVDGIYDYTLTSTDYEGRISVVSQKL